MDLMQNIVAAFNAPATDTGVRVEELTAVSLSKMLRIVGDVARDFTDLSSAPIPNLTGNADAMNALLVAAVGSNADAIGDLCDEIVPLQVGEKATRDLPIESFLPRVLFVALAVKARNADLLTRSVAQLQSLVASARKATAPAQPAAHSGQRHRNNRKRKGR
jgi:hypothetical protein